MYLDFIVTDETSAPVAWTANSVVMFNNVPLAYGTNGYTVPVALGDTGVVSVQIISDSGLNVPYEATFTVFGYDLVIPIKLITYAVHDSNDIFGSIYGYQKPCSNELYFYWTSSDTPNEIDWLVNGVEVLQAKNNLFAVFNKCNSEFTYDQVQGELVKAIAYKKQYGSNCGCSGTTVATAEIEFEIVQRLFKIQAQFFDEQTNSCSSGDCDCYILGESITAYSIVEFPDYSYTVEGVETQLCDELSLTMSVYESGDTTNVLATETYTLSTASKPLVFTEAESLVFTLDSKGTYTISYQVGTCCCEKTYTKDIEICNNYNVTQITCNTYQFENCSSTQTYWIRLYQVAKNYYGQTIPDYPIPTSSAFILGSSTSFLSVLPQSTLDITMPKDGIYVFQISTSEGQNETTKTFVWYNWCNLRECYLNVLLKILCSENEPCCDHCAEKDMWMLNKFMAQYQLLFSIINLQHQNEVYIEGALYKSKLTSLFDVEVLLNKLEKLCKIMGDCGCQSDVSSIKTGGDCGC